MEKIKYLILLLAILCLCGCNKKSTDDNWNLITYIDKDTCVEYFMSDGAYNKGNVTPKYNVDGTLKLNKECSNENGGK